MGLERGDRAARRRCRDARREAEGARHGAGALGEDRAGHRRDAAGVHAVDDERRRVRRFRIEAEPAGACEAGEPASRRGPLVHGTQYRELLAGFAHRPPKQRVDRAGRVVRTVEDVRSQRGSHADRVGRDDVRTGRQLFECPVVQHRFVPERGRRDPCVMLAVGGRPAGRREVTGAPRFEIGDAGRRLTGEIVERTVVEPAQPARAGGLQGGDQPRSAAQTESRVERTEEAGHGRIFGGGSRPRGRQNPETGELHAERERVTARHVGEGPVIAEHEIETIGDGVEARHEERGTVEPQDRRHVAAGGRVEHGAQLLVASDTDRGSQTGPRRTGRHRARLHEEHVGVGAPQLHHSLVRLQRDRPGVGREHALGLRRPDAGEREHTGEVFVDGRRQRRDQLLGAQRLERRGTFRLLVGVCGLEPRPFGTLPEHPYECPRRLQCPLPRFGERVDHDPPDLVRGRTFEFAESLPVDAHHVELFAQCFDLGARLVGVEVVVGGALRGEPASQSLELGFACDEAGTQCAGTQLAEPQQVVLVGEGNAGGDRLEHHADRNVPVPERYRSRDSPGLAAQQVDDAMHRKFRFRVAEEQHGAARTGGRRERCRHAVERAVPAWVGAKRSTTSVWSSNLRPAASIPGTCSTPSGRPRYGVRSSSPS